MPGGRVSKRLQGQPPSIKNSAKRTRRPNKNTLDTFQETQVFIRQVKGQNKPPIQAKVSSKPPIQ
jgi:hypothetical protein